MAEVEVAAEAWLEVARETGGRSSRTFPAGRASMIERRRRLDWSAISLLGSTRDLAVLAGFLRPVKILLGAEHVFV